MCVYVCEALKGYSYISLDLLLQNDKKINFDTLNEFVLLLLNKCFSFCLNIALI